MDLPTQLARRAAHKVIRQLDQDEEHIARTIYEVTKLPQWKAALEGLTPSGSEFVDDPERCRQFVKDRLDNGHTMLMDSLRRCKAIEEALAPIIARLEPENPYSTSTQFPMIQASEIDALRKALGRTV